MMMVQQQMRNFAKYSSQGVKEFDVNMDYYNILGVENTATDAEILQGFRNQVKIYHPENNNDIVS